MTTNAPVPSPYSHTQNIHDWQARRPPSVNEAALALADLHIITRSQNTTICSDDVLRTRLDNLNQFLAIYTAGKGWAKAADYTASVLGRGATCSRQLQAWAKNFSHDCSALSYHSYSNSGCNSLLDDAQFVEELRAHITDIRRHFPTQAIIDFVKKPEVVEHYHILKPITLKTARKWMSKLDFTWREAPKGTYLNGHERPNVMHYHQNIYLPALAQYELTVQAWNRDNLTHLIDPSSPSPIRHSVLWFNDQCIFYQNDWRKC